MTQARADEVKAKKLGVFKNPPNNNNSEAAYFVDYVTRQLIKKYGAAQTFNGGLRVHTSIDMDWQKAASSRSRSTIGGLDYGGWSPSGALVAIDPETGYIRTMVGGTDFKKQKFNLAWQSRRQAGSAMKTFVLTSAVEMGMNPASTYYVSHSPTIIPMGPAPAPWIVNTYDHSSAGRITVSAATVRSDNSVYAQLCMDTGPENVVETAQKMGIASPLAAVPSITLGTEAVNPLEMAVAYATLASGGIYHPPQAIVKVVVPGGKVDWKPKTKGRRVLSAGVAYTVNMILQTNASSGTGAGTAAYVPRPRAGKTGTTDDYVDAWYCGYTPNLADRGLDGLLRTTPCTRCPAWPARPTACRCGASSTRSRSPTCPRSTSSTPPWSSSRGRASTRRCRRRPRRAAPSRSPDADQDPVNRPTKSPTTTPTPTPTPTKTPTPTPTPASTGAARRWTSAERPARATRALAQARRARRPVRLLAQPSRSAETSRPARHRRGGPATYQLPYLSLPLRYSLTSAPIPSLMVRMRQAISSTLVSW